MKRLHFGLPFLAVAACGGSDPATSTDAGDDTPAADAAPGTPDAAPAPAVPDLTICEIPDAANPASAFVVTSDADWVHYDCATPCADWTACATGLRDPSGNALMSARGGPIDVLAFVVDGMGGHFGYTTDGTDVVVTHGGSGGNSFYNVFDAELQANSDLKTVTLGWMDGSTAIFDGAGWFTRTSAPGTTVRALAGRPAAAIQWVKDHFAVGKRLGTVGSSMGTAATFGAHVWYGLDPIIDYQMLIGGPGFWDVNAGCGRVHLATGFCDVDAAPCTGTAFSSFGDNDPSCDTTTTNQCRTPTIMAPNAGGPTGSAYNDCINYVGATDTCTMLAGDDRDAALDASSLAFTVDTWSFRGRIDFVADEGGVQPPDADQGMGEGHMLQIYAQITSAKGWIDYEGRHHGDAWRKIPALIHESALRVIDGMQQ